MNEATKIASIDVHQWDWVDWAVMGGVLFLVLFFVMLMFFILRKLFDKQLVVLGKAVDERARVLYLDHLPFINEKISGEIRRLEVTIANQTASHDKDVLFLLQEIDRLERLVANGANPQEIRELKLTKEEEAQRALQILLARIRKDAL